MISDRSSDLQPVLLQSPAPPAAGNQQMPFLWMGLSAALAIGIAGLFIYGQRKLKQVRKEKRFEEFKNRELQKKLRLALQTISKMERNPDLIHSREFNLDYMRMRMEEEQFRFIVTNQIKIKVKEKISLALRTAPASQGGIVGIASTGRHIDEQFDVEYTLYNTPKPQKRVLFRIQIKLTKLPNQATSATIAQVIGCLEKFMSPEGEDDNWQPVIQSKIASLRWDQKAKPTPLLVLEQLNEGSNVTYRTDRMVKQRTK